MEEEGGERESSVPSGSTIPPVINRTLPGAAHHLNRGSLSWGWSGCVAYGSGSLVVVVEPATSQLLQTLARHRLSVIRTAWPSPLTNGDEGRVSLASADASGQIIIWDLLQGQSVKLLSDGNQPISDLVWLDGRLEKTNHLLLAIHPPNHLVLWNTLTGVKLWKFSYDETLLALDLDPFACHRLMFRCQNCVLLVDDLHPEKSPRSPGKRFYILGGKGGSPGPVSGTGAAALETPSSVGPTATAKAKSTKGTKLTKIMRQMVLGESRQSSGTGSAGSPASSQAECISAKYHRAIKDQVLLAFPKEVLLVDLVLGQTVGAVSLERTHSPLAALLTASCRELFYILHESGSVSVWTRKKELTVLATPSIARSQSMLGFVRTPLVGSSSNTSGYMENNFTLAGSDVLLEVAYESRVQSDNIRMGKNCGVLGLALQPSSERQLALLTSDGRLLMLSLTEVGRQRRVEKLVVTAILGATAPTASVIRMCPAVTVRNWSDYQPLLAAGSVTGNILIYNLSSGVLQRELAVHTSAVKGLEWTTGNPAHSVLSFCHHPLASSHLVRNELIHTNILSGKTKNLRVDRGEESPMRMLRISHVKQYFVIAFASAPFELWDLKKLCILRTMPKKFPIVTALAWSPLHTSRSKRKSAGTGVGEEQEQEPSVEDTVSLKEHILFTDQDSQLYHFSVEGHSIRDGTKVPAETGLGIVHAISCKSDYIVRGDADGNINIWNIKIRQSKNIHTGRGNIHQIRFSPGRGNLKILVLHNDGVAIWDIKEMKFIHELKSPQDIPEVMGVDWAASDRVILACQDGAIRIMGFDLSGANSSVMHYPRDQMLSSATVLPPKSSQRLAFYLALNTEQEEEISAEDEQQQITHIHNLYGQLVSQSSLQASFAARNLLAALLLGRPFEAKLWTLVASRTEGGVAEEGRNFDILCDKVAYMRLQEEICQLHLNRAADRKSRAAVTARLLCMGKLDPAVKLLVDSDPEEESFLADQHLACLISAVDATVGGGHLSTTKTVATKLIAEGQLWEGVQLLCLIGKVADACTYLKASKHWEESLWLARCRLGDDEYKDIAAKYADYLLAQGRIQEAALVHASVENWSECLAALHVGQYRGLAALLLQHVGHQDIEPVLTEAIWLEAARLLLEVGDDKLATQYSKYTGDKGRELLKEFRKM